MASYLVQEEDGTSRILLEEGSGFLVTEESVVDLELEPGQCGLELGDGSGLLVLGDGTGLLLLEQCVQSVTVGHNLGSGIQRHPIILDDEEAVAIAVALLV